MNDARHDRALVVGRLVASMLRPRPIVIHQLRDLLSIQREDTRLRVVRHQHLRLEVRSPQRSHMVASETDPLVVDVLRQRDLQRVLLHRPRQLVHGHEARREDEDPLRRFGHAHHPAQPLLVQQRHDGRRVVRNSWE